MNDYQKYVLELWIYRLNLQSRIHELTADSRDKEFLLSKVPSKWKLLEAVLRQSIAPPGTGEDHRHLSENYKVLRDQIIKIRDECTQKGTSPQLNELEKIAQRKAFLGAEYLKNPSPTLSEKRFFEKARDELKSEGDKIFGRNGLKEKLLDKEFKTTFDESQQNGGARPWYWKANDRDLEQHHQTCYAIAEGIYHFRLVPASVFAIGVVNLIRHASAIWTWLRGSSKLNATTLMKTRGPHLLMWGSLTLASYFSVNYLEKRRREVLNLASSLEEKREIYLVRIASSEKDQWKSLKDQSQQDMQEDIKKKEELLNSTFSCVMISYKNLRKPFVDAKDRIAAIL